MGTIDRVLAFAGFALTLWQLHRTRTAAHAARDSAMQATVAIRKLSAATKMHDIAGRSRELFRVFWLRNYDAAAYAVFELRDTIARYRHDEQSRSIVSAKAWAKAADDVERVHETIIYLAQIPRANETEWHVLLKEVIRLHILFTSLAAAAAASGAPNANA
ncbi:MAG: hypothetical protein ABW202_14610 [Duganella sp.]